MARRLVCNILEGYLIRGCVSHQEPFDLVLLCLFVVFTIVIAVSHILDRDFDHLSTTPKVLHKPLRLELESSFEISRRARLILHTTAAGRFGGYHTRLKGLPFPHNFIFFSGQS